jgi:hypothetical protein
MARNPVPIPSPRFAKRHASVYHASAIGPWILGLLAEVHPDHRRSWVIRERRHMQLVFEL